MSLSYHTKATLLLAALACSLCAAVPARQDGLSAKRARDGTLDHDSGRCRCTHAGTWK
jgi:hypothetical protein